MLISSPAIPDFLLQLFLCKTFFDTPIMEHCCTSDRLTYRAVSPACGAHVVPFVVLIFVEEADSGHAVGLRHGAMSFARLCVLRTLSAAIPRSRRYPSFNVATQAATFDPPPPLVKCYVQVLVDAHEPEVASAVLLRDSTRPSVNDSLGN